MKPLKLTLNSFGPYAGEQIIDFTLLGERSLFLIHGPTGSGKSSVLDAMCYALYGQVDSGKAPADLRSHHAEPRDECLITFDFSIGPRRYRVRRRPSQQRQALRGENKVNVEPEASLWELSGDGEKVLAEQQNKVTEQVERLIGFKCDQFRQVVVLPQGQFAELLHAKPMDRQLILENLFQADLYSRIQGALRARWLEAKEHWQNLTLECQAALKRYQAADLDQVNQMLVQARQAQADAATEAEKCQAAEKQSRQALERGREVERLGKELRDAEQHLKKLKAQQGDIALLQGKHQAGVRASAMRELDKAATQRKSEHENAQGQCAAQEEKVTAAARQSQVAETEMIRQDQLVSQRQEWAKRLEELKRYKAAVDSLAELEVKKNVSAKSLGDAKSMVAKTRAALVKSQNQEQAQAQVLEKLERCAQTLTACKLLSEKCEALIKQRRQLEQTLAALPDLQTKRDQCDSDIAAAQGGIDAAGHGRKLLLKQWRDSQAALLAAGLSDGQPCPVCGSAHHPAPASGTGDAAGIPAQLEALETQIAEDEKKLRRLLQHRATHDSHLEAERKKQQELQAALQERATIQIEALEKEYSQTQQNALDAEQAEKQLEAATKKLAVLRASNATLQADEQRLIQEVERHTASLNKEEATIAERSNNIPADQRHSETLGQTITHLTEQIKTGEAQYRAAQVARQDAVSQLAAATAADAQLKVAREAAQQAWQIAQRELLERIGQAQFDSVAAYRAALVEENQLQQWDGQISTYHIDLGAALDRHRRAAQEAGELPAVDVAALEAELHQCDEKRRGADGQSQDAKRRVEELERLLAELIPLLERIAQAEKDCNCVGALHEVAGGERGRKITFQRYVLSVYLDDVMAAATQRMLLMSRQRYWLRRDPQSAGLEMEVFDQHTGTSRPISTLSGGETFLASLSLALALADVVQARAGGIRLETIFVDEGFGTLDQEVLELAMRALMDLQRGGRLVGVISHVTEMREMIPTRLQITPCGKGSAARFVLD